jgi:hypothetical protein
MHVATWMRPGDARLAATERQTTVRRDPPSIRLLTVTNAELASCRSLAMSMVRSGLIEEVRFATDSALEGDGFELLVPRHVSSTPAA